MNINETAAPVDRKRILGAAAALGVLGAGAQNAPRIMAALCNPTVGAATVSALIEKEPALYARVLRVANSAYYRQARAIATVERAVVLLGLDAVRGIAAAVCLDRAVPRGVDGSLLDMGRLVQHSVATAAAAESLALGRHRSLAAEAFIAGLLHNLGIPAQLQLDPAGVRALLERCAADGCCDIRDLETQCVTVGHEHCIAVIFEEWQLPSPLVAAIRHHHDPMSASEAVRPLASLIHLGSVLALETGFTFGLEPAARRQAAAMDCLDVTDDQMDSIASELPGRVTQLTDALMAPAP